MLELQSRCWTQARIAAEMGIERRVVGRTLERLNEQAWKDIRKRAEGIKARQLAQLDRIALESFAEWERSRRAARTARKSSVSGAAGGKTEREEKTTRQQTGDPMLLREARGALADARKILGLDAPPPRPAEGQAARNDYVIDLGRPNTPEGDPPHNPA